MKLVVIEPLGVEEAELRKIAEEKLPSDVELIYYDTKVTDTEELIQRGKEADIIAVSNLPLNGEVIRGCKNLKLLSVAFTGVDHIDLEACREQKVTVCNCAGYSTAAVTDLVFGLLIDLYRNIIPCNQTVRQGGTKDGLVGYELEGKRFGIVGTGAIGMRVARIAHAFGCEICAYSRTEKEVDWINYMSLEELLRTCDILSLHTPLTQETKGLIGKEQLALMKDTAVLINTSRGPVVDSKALAEALNTGKLAGAAVDVFETEPPIEKEHPLFSARNLIATPHIAFATQEAMVKRAHIVFQNVAAWQKGYPENLIGEGI